MAINLDRVSVAAVSSEDNQKIREGKRSGRVWFPRRRSGAEDATGGGSSIWPRSSVLVAISETGRLVAETARHVGAAVKDLVRQHRIRSGYSYGPDGDMRQAHATMRNTVSTQNKPAQAGQGSPTASIWPLSASRVTLSETSRLAAGVIANLDATPEEQNDFLAQIRAADRQGRFSGTVLAGARRLVQTFLAPEVS
ncbi:MAG: hypothetical protein HQL65_12340 [Magnetococcales bacterium]|nr:hypothetical protein [Magnetococcales bacterium]